MNFKKSFLTKTTAALTLSAMLISGNSISVLADTFEESGIQTEVVDAEIKTTTKK